MKKHGMLLFALLFMACSNKANYPWFLGSFDDAKSAAGEKLIMLDFYAAW
jgi:thiol:disulfide interchange protein